MDPTKRPNYTPNSSNYTNQKFLDFSERASLPFSSQNPQTKRVKFDSEDHGSVYCTQCSAPVSVLGNYPSLNCSDGRLIFCREECLSIYKIANRRAVKCLGCGVTKSLKNMLCGGKDRYYCSQKCFEFAKPTRGRPRKRPRAGRFGASRHPSPNKRTKNPANFESPSSHMKNKSVQNEVLSSNKSLIHKPSSCDASSQTELDFNSLETTLLPIPVPFHQILPMCLYEEEIPFTMLVPVPVPIPIPFTTSPPVIKEIKSEPRTSTKMEDVKRVPPKTIALENSSGNVLKHSYGVNAWNNWLTSRIQRSSGMVYPDLVFSTPLVLNDALCQFLREIRKPTGEQYASDSVYYLCLGIQHYLNDCGRGINIFSDVGDFRGFTDLLDSILRSWDPRLNQNGQLICRIQEEHLWETRQLGTTSPQAILNTILYFNTKYFLLRSANDHLNLSFSNIIKQSRKVMAPNSGYGQTTRQLCLCYYPKHSSLAENSRLLRGDEVLEQPENVGDVSRCPVRIYDFYLSKCPVGVRSRSDLFYLRPDNAEGSVWFIAESMESKDIDKMMRRILLVKEIQEAFLVRQGRI